MRNDAGFDDKVREFWRLKARKYPSALDPDTLAKTLRVIDMVRSRGLRIKDTIALDIGCGTGTFTIPLAREARKATGIDFSSEMIEKLRQAADDHCIRNVEALCMSWHDADLNALGFTKAFDSAWASMTMAIRSDDDLLKMQNSARDFCVYVGWGRKRDNELMNRIFSDHGLELRPPDGAGRTFEKLKLMGYKPELKYIDTSWRWQGSVDEAVDEMRAHVAMQGAEPDEEIIREHLLSYADGEFLEHTTFAEQGVIIWKPE